MSSRPPGGLDQPTYTTGSDRQNALAAALKEYGALRETIYAARYLADETYRRRISRQLNKGESVHALRRDVFFAHEGHVRHRHLEAGVDITVVSKRLGHASVKTTANLYAHITECLQTTAAERFGACILAKEIPTLPALHGSMT